MLERIEPGPRFHITGFSFSFSLYTFDEINAQGTDILIEDDTDPDEFGGSFVSCSIAEPVVFCDGLDGIVELLGGDHSNTNCDTNGDTTDATGKCV